MSEVGLSEEASIGENSCRKALDRIRESEMKSRRVMGFISIAIFLLGLLFCPPQNQGGGNNWGSDSWKSLDLVIIKPVGPYRLVMW